MHFEDDMPLVVIIFPPNAMEYIRKAKYLA